MGRSESSTIIMISKFLRKVMNSIILNRQSEKPSILLIGFMVMFAGVPSTLPLSSLQREEPGVIILNAAAEALGWPERTGNNLISHTETKPDGGSVFYGATFIGEYQSYDDVYFIAGTGDSVVGGTEAWVQWTVSTEGAGDIEQRIYFKVGPWWFKIRVAAYPWRRGEHPEPNGIPVAEALYQAAIDYLSRVEETPEPSPIPDFSSTPQQDLCGNVVCEPAYCASEHESHFDGTCDPADGQCYYWSQQCEAGCNADTGLCNTKPDKPPAGPWDLSIQRLSLIQAIEGGQLVASKPTALRAYIHWPDPDTNINAEVSLYIDGFLFKTLTHLCKHEYSPTDRYHNWDTANFHIPANLLNPGNHTFLVQASLTALTNEQMHIEDPDLLNNVDVLTDIEFVQTRSLHLLMGSVHEDIDGRDILNYISRGRPYLMDVYPVEDVVIIDTFYMIRNVYPDIMATQTLNLALKRLLYNSQLPPGMPKADYAVGIFPDGAYDSFISGNEVGGGSFWWGRNNVLVGLADQRPVSIHAIAHEIGHDLLFGWLEEYNMDQQHNVGFYLPSHSVIYKGQEGILEDLSATGAQYINFMGTLTNQAWVNTETWNQLVGEFRLINPSARSTGALAAPAIQSQEGTTSGFVAIGAISQDQTVRVDSLIWLDQIQFSDISDGESDFWFEFVNTQGQRLAAVPIIVDFSVSDPAPFIAVIPMDKGSVTQLSITSHGKEIWARTPSDHAPQIQIETPAVQAASEQQVEVIWSADDEDGDDLTYTLLYSRDGGSSWLPLASDLTSKNYLLDTGAIPGCENCQLRVLANDGWNSSTATTIGSFIVHDKSPSILISYPDPEAEVSPGEPLTLLATAYDPEDGLLDDSSVTWYSEKDGFLGEGARLILTNLSLGDHVINAYAYDAKGNAGQAYVHVHVLDNTNNSSGDFTATLTLIVFVFLSILFFVLFGLGLILRKNWLWISACALQAVLWILAAVFFIVVRIFD